MYKAIHYPVCELNAPILTSMHIDASLTSMQLDSALFSSCDNLFIGPNLVPLVG